MLELDDIQHFLLTRPPALAARYAFLTFQDPAQGRAWLAGIVQGVVVQMTTLKGAPSKLPDGNSTRSASARLSTTLNATSIAGEVCSWYSTSASASALRQSKHQLTGFRPR